VVLCEIPKYENFWEVTMRNSVMYHIWKRRYSDLDPEQTMLHAGQSIRSARNLLFFVHPVQTYPGAFSTLKHRKENREKQKIRISITLTQSYLTYRKSSTSIQMKYTVCSLVSVGDWLQNTSQTPKCADAQVRYIKWYSICP
jgi:hypothetical protein